MNRQAGFTLLEVLVSMAIFAVIGLSANKMLRDVLNAHDKTTDRVTAFSQYTRAFGVMQRDFVHGANRGIRDEYGEFVPPLTVATGDYAVELTRAAWNNPLGAPRSNLQRVAYELNDDGELIRHFWVQLDRAQDAEPISQRLLTDVLDFRIMLVTDKATTTDSWPDNDNPALLPNSIEVFVDTEAYGELRRVYAFVNSP